MRLLRPLFPLLVLLLFLSACESGGTGTSADNDDSSESTDQPRGREASRNDTAIVSLLNDMCGQSINELFKTDDYRDRLSKDWGQVIPVLQSANASFRREGKHYCTASVEHEMQEIDYVVMLMLDTKRDLVFAAQYDSKSHQMQSWSEDENAALPPGMDEWTGRFSQSEEE